ncbi:hypothetical protein BaRGS_00019473, partial [Batillaria attramentaria]
MKPFSIWCVAILLLKVTDAFRLTQEPVAVYDVTTESWHVVLKCGAVDRNGQSNVDVLWRAENTAVKKKTSELLTDNISLRKEMKRFH